VRRFVKGRLNLKEIGKLINEPKSNS
jgi:hypothetical protein